MVTINIDDDPKMKLWLSNYSKKNTQNLYRSSLQAYSDFTKKTPTQLITEAKNDIRSGLFMDDRAIFTDLILFSAHLQEKGVAPKTKALRLAAVRSFFSNFYIDVPKLKNQGKANPLEKNKAIPSKEEIREVLDVADLLAKAIVLTGVSSGLAAEEIKDLKISEYKKGLDKATGICTLILRREKTGQDFVCFLNPEATKAIDNYIAYRGRTLKGHDTKREAQLEKQKIIDDDGYLFILQNVPKQYLVTHDEELRRMTKDSFTKLYNNLSMKVGKQAKAGDRNIIRSHNIRRYYNSTLRNQGAPEQFIEFTMGHKGNATQEAYYVAAPEKLKEIYIKYMPYLTIQSELSITESMDFKNAIEERDHYKALAQKYLIDNVELLNAKSELATLKFKTLNPEQQKEELIKSITELKPVLSSNPTDKDREHADYENKMRDMILQILKGQESL